MNDVRGRVIDVLFDHYGHANTECVDEIMHAIDAVTPEPTRDTVAALLTEAHRKLYATITVGAGIELEDVNTNDLHNAIVLVIAAVKELAK